MSHPKLGFTKDVLANRVLPFVFPLCIDSNLNLQQVRTYFVKFKTTVIYSGNRFLLTHNIML